jgi:hypothetical protein
MAKGVPSKVKDKARRTKIFDYRIPITVGARQGALLGTLWWSPPKDGGAPLGAIIALVALVLLGGGAVVIARRRRRPGDDGDGDEPVRPAEPAEAW